jgi:hypothetical protein
VATKLTTAANAILLQYTAPIYAALLGVWFLNERITWLDWATIAIVLGGMALFFLDHLTTGGLWGNVCAVSEPGLGIPGDRRSARTMGFPRRRNRTGRGYGALYDARAAQELALAYPSLHFLC